MLLSLRLVTCPFAFPNGHDATRQNNADKLGNEDGDNDGHDDDSDCDFQQMISNDFHLISCSIQWNVLGSPERCNPMHCALRVQT